MAFTVQHFFKRFPDDATCLIHLMNVRYGESLDCPKCGKHGRFTQLNKMPAFACAWCGHHIQLWEEVWGFHSSNRLVTNLMDTRFMPTGSETLLMRHDYSF